MACIDILTYVRMDMGEGVLVCWSAILLCQARSTSSRGEMSLECVLAGAVGATGRASGENGRAMAYISIGAYGNMCVIFRLSESDCFLQSLLLRLTYDQPSPNACTMVSDREAASAPPDGSGAVVLLPF